MKRLASTLLLACAALAACASIARGARADEPQTKPQTKPQYAAQPTTIAVIGGAPDDRFGLRVVAELEALGLRAVLLDPEYDSPTRASLEASARAAGAVAAIRAVPSERGVEVWIADRVTGKTVLREIAVDDGAPEPDAALALRAVELLRASLLEVTLPSPSRGEVPATPEIRAKMRLDPPKIVPPERPAPTLRLSLAPGALLSPGGFGASASLDLGLAWMPSEHVGVVASAAIPLSDARAEGQRGSADLSVFLGGGAVRFLFTRRSSLWSPTVDLGVSVVSLKTTGTPTPGFIGSEPSAVTVAPMARLGLAFAVTPTVRVRADVLASVIVEGVSIRFHQLEAATYGRPVVLSSAGVDFGWF